MAEIIDIRVNDLKTALKPEILRGLGQEKGNKTLPTMLLYDEKGLRLFEAITYLESYYLTGAEIQILRNCAAEIAQRVPDNCVLLELGSGNLRKIAILLDELERTKKTVDYYALDLSLDELKRTLDKVPRYQYVRCRGLWGTYEDGLTWLNKPANREKPTWIMSMGSSMGNFSGDQAGSFLRDFARLLGPFDSMLIALDGSQDAEKVTPAYSANEPVSRAFYLNALDHANSVLGYKAFKRDEWDVTGYFSDGCYKSFFVPLKDITIEGVMLKRGEKIFFEQSCKYAEEDRRDLWRKAELSEQEKWGNPTGEYHIHLLSSARTHFPMHPNLYAATAVPSLPEFERLWHLWDAVTAMVPNAALYSKPIDLRNPIIFYLGHIPTFLDMHLSRATDGRLTNGRYPSIFERGIDPDVDNPERCHPHSEVPNQYPPVEEIRRFQEEVRQRTRSLLQDDMLGSSRRLSEALWLGFEHEVMHIETFLYMLLQSPKTRPPHNVPRPDFGAIAKRAHINAVPNEWFEIPEQVVSVGLDDPDPSVIPQSFGWDNEKPRRSVSIGAFRAKGRAITNGEYAKYLELNNVPMIPASWMAKESNGTVRNGHAAAQGDGERASPEFLDKYLVRTVFGPVPLKFALDWPVAASFNELDGYAKSVNCRIPSFEEAQSIYQHAAVLKSSTTNGVHQSNGHSTCPDHTQNGVANGKSHTAGHQTVDGAKHANGQPVYIDLNGCNVGFQNWNPTPVTDRGRRLCGRGEFGGVWEWTSSRLEPHAGFRAMDLYPGYTADFFDEKHNICLGGSWATHPRIAGRTSFVNWYQRNYPFVWAGARLVQDVLAN